jgi:pimeloyl-ACP methyl ester carboxylesterase
MEKVELANGMRLAYEGETEGRNGTPVIFIHGAGGSRHKWAARAQKAAASLPSSPVIAVDLPGHGDSQGEAQSDVAAYAEIIEQLMKTISPGRPAIVIGHSMGGAIGQELALRYPDQLKALVLVTTGAKLGVDPVYLEKLKAGERDPERAKLAFSPSADPSLIEMVQSQEAYSPVESAYRDFLACSRFDRRADIQTISVPTLVIGGEDDRMTPPKFSAFLAEKIPDAQLVLVPKAGHYVMIEQPEAVDEALIPFLQKWA